MYATVEDLKKGDVVIIGNSKGIVEAKLLRQPCLAKTGKKLTWGGNPRWTSVLCAVREETINRMYTAHNGQQRPYTFKAEVMANGKDYNKERRVDFSEKEVWIIKREKL